MNIKDLRKKFERKKGQYLQLKQEIQDLKSKINRTKLKIMDLEKSQTIIQIVAKQTQDELKYMITSPATLALDVVFPEEELSLELEFSFRRDKTEADFWFDQRGSLFEPLRSSGGGVVDTVAFSLRPSLLPLHYPPLRKVLILDEPFKWLDKERLPLAAEMLRTTDKLGLQIIMTTHSEELISCANKIFRVKKEINGRSQIVEEIEND